MSWTFFNSVVLIINKYNKNDRVITFENKEFIIILKGVIN